MLFDFDALEHDAPPPVDDAADICVVSVNAATIVSEAPQEGAGTVAIGERLEVARRELSLVLRALKEGCESEVQTLPPQLPIADHLKLALQHIQAALEAGFAAHVAGHVDEVETSDQDEKEKLQISDPWPGQLHSLERFVLWPPRSWKPVLAPAYSKMDVCVFGAHHCCTGAMMRELPRFFNVTVKNKRRSDAPSFWKHSIYQASTLPKFNDRTFSVCLVKDPAFWIQSLARDPAEGTFYEIVPLGAWPTSRAAPQVGLMPMEPHCRSQLFGPVLFDGAFYSDAVSVWEATVHSYFDSALFPAARTAVVRCEDFLFSFEAVIRELAKRGLPLREDAPCCFEPMDVTAKDSSHPECTRRNRQELLCYYRNPDNHSRDAFHVFSIH
jgi:hypothetical protein